MLATTTIPAWRGRAVTDETEKEERERWRNGAARAEVARQTVAEQLSIAVTEREETGSADVFTQRLRAVSEARQRGDPFVLRAALFEMNVAGAQWLVDVDLALDPQGHRR